MDDICDRFPSEPYRMPRRQPEPFFTELPPCEACGRPAERREWNAEHQLWIGVNCACSELLVPAMVRRILGVTVMYASQNNAAEPVCPSLERSILACRNVREIVSACKQHREYCPECKPAERKETQKAGDSETQQVRRAA